MRRRTMRHIKIHGESNTNRGDKIPNGQSPEDYTRWKKLSNIKKKVVFVQIDIHSSVKNYGAEKMRVYANNYYKHRCETDSNFRAKMNERKKEAYRERKIRECGSEVLYMMVRPGRPRKYQTATPLETNTLSTPSTTANNSTHGSVGETEHAQRDET